MLTQRKSSMLCIYCVGMWVSVLGCPPLLSITYIWDRVSHGRLKEQPIIHTNWNCLYFRLSKCEAYLCSTHVPGTCGSQGSGHLGLKSQMVTSWHEHAGNQTQFFWKSQVCLTLSPALSDKFSYWTWKSQIQLHRLPNTPQGSSCLFLSKTRITHINCHIWVLSKGWDLNSCTQTHAWSLKVLLAVFSNWNSSLSTQLLRYGHQGIVGCPVTLKWTRWCWTLSLCVLVIIWFICCQWGF